MTTEGAGPVRPPALPAEGGAAETLAALDALVRQLRVECAWDRVQDERTIEKTVFSAARADGFELEGRAQAIVCGIETHVCVSQTVHDLLAEGVEVHVPADAVGSRHAIDYERGLERLERAGAVVSTVEAALFELLERAGTPEFKEVQKLIL